MGKGVERKTVHKFSGGRGSNTILSRNGVGPVESGKHAGGAPELRLVRRKRAADGPVLAPDWGAGDGPAAQLPLLAASAIFAAWSVSAI
jgi:hypothetical protein